MSGTSIIAKMFMSLSPKTGEWYSQFTDHVACVLRALLF